MTIAIVGYGFVGKAHHHVFQNYDVVVIDPLYNNTTLKDIPNLEGIFCCVSTPSTDSGECDYTNIVDVLTETDPSTPVLIKSTVSLQGWNSIRNKFKHHQLNFSPEFLRASSANEDIENLKYLILSSGDAYDFWTNFYSKFYKDLEFYKCSAEEAISIKYFENAFLATKLSFFNQIYDFCKEYELDFESVRAGMSLDPRINNDHTYVDPVQGLRGWGGYCFPKDTAALLNMAKTKNINLNILDTVVDYNIQIRKNLNL